MDFVYSSSVSILSWESNIDGEFIEVGMSLDWGVLTLGENERICNEYGDYVFPFYECIFLILGLWLLFNGFKMEVRKHLMVATPQVYPSS